MKKREDIFFLFLFVHSHRIRRFTTSFPSKCKGRSLLSCHSSVGNSLCSLTQSLAVHFGQSLRDKTIYLSADDAAEADPSCRKAGREGGPDDAHTTARKFVFAPAGRNGLFSFSALLPAAKKRDLRVQVLCYRGLCLPMAGELGPIKLDKKNI